MMEPITGYTVLLCYRVIFRFPDEDAAVRRQAMYDAVNDDDARAQAKARYGDNIHIYRVYDIDSEAEEN